MKSLLLVLLITGLSVASCTTIKIDQAQQLSSANTQQHVSTPKVINIPSIKIEVLPNKAECELPVIGGAIVKSQCIQYRQPFQKHYNTLTGGIQGFDFEPGYRYLLDIRQQAVIDEETGQSKPVWILNKIVSKIED